MVDLLLEIPVRVVVPVILINVMRPVETAKTRVVPGHEQVLLVKEGLEIALGWAMVLMNDRVVLEEGVAEHFV